MKFISQDIPDLFVIELQPIEDDRGSFYRNFCLNEFRNNLSDINFVQINCSNNRYKGTLRGLHFQNKPHQEDKLIRCLNGSIFDVAVDLRKESKTYLKWFGVELNAKNMKMLFVPKGFAHGYLTLTDNSEIQYLVSEYYSPKFESGLHFNDPTININWPMEVSHISYKDKNWKYI